MPSYRSYASYLRERYGNRALRVCVDAGLGCPHRDAGSGSGGCIFCEEGARGATHPPAVAEQIDAALGRARPGQREPELLLYFQSTCGTNASPMRLREIYDSALRRASFRELIVATRPDCIDAERAELIGSYRDRGLDVWVEMGLQSALDRTLLVLERGHDFAEFRRAFDLLRSRGIKVAAHLIFGLPGERREETLESVRLLAALEPQGIKIHNLHVCRGTPLARLYLRGEVTVPSADSHLRTVAAALELLPAETVVMRLTTDTPAAILLAPSRFPDKAAFIRRLEEIMRGEGRCQGRLFGRRQDPRGRHAPTKDS